MNEQPCRCGHAKDEHTESGCSKCPTSPIWVDYLADWVTPCARYQPR